MRQSDSPGRANALVKKDLAKTAPIPKGKLRARRKADEENAASGVGNKAVAEIPLTLSTQMLKHPQVFLKAAGNSVHWSRHPENTRRSRYATLGGTPDGLSNL